MRWVAAIVMLFGCGRIGFDASSASDARGGDDADAMVMIDAAPPFAPTQVTNVDNFAAGGAIAKIGTDGASLYLARSDLDSVEKYVGTTAMTFASGIDTPGGITYWGGYFYVSERGANRIVRVDSSGLVEPFAGSGGSGTQDGAGTTATFSTPRGLATDGTYVYVADRGASCLVRRIAIATRVVDTIAGVPGGANCTLVDGDRATARMIAPGGLVVVGGTLYVTDTPAIRAIDLATKEVTTLAGTATTGFADATGSAARFSTSISEIVERNGVLYIADSYNFRIRTVDIATGAAGTLVGNGNDGDDPGSIGTTSLHEPDGLVFIGTALYVASDLSIHRID